MGTKIDIKITDMVKPYPCACGKVYPVHNGQSIVCDCGHCLSFVFPIGFILTRWRPNEGVPERSL